jgi:hypothetical protein
MADPFSITAGVIGLLSSLATLSTQINDFRRDFKGASLEVSQLAQEVDDLAQILQRLDEAQVSRSLPMNLAKNLGNVLGNLNRYVIQIELHLKRVSGKKMKAAYWAFTGKKEYLQLCRGLESYKSTLNIILTLSTM